MTQRYETLTPDDIVMIHFSGFMEEDPPWCKEMRYDPEDDENHCTEDGLRCEDCLRAWLEEEVTA